MGFVQSAHGTATSGSSVAATFATATKPGNTIIACVSTFNISPIVTVSSITPGLAKARAVSINSQDCEIWFLVDTAGGHTTITATLSGTINDATIDIIEWAGIVSLDKVNSGSNASSGTWTSNSTGALASPLEVAVGTVFATAVSAVTVTPPGAPWTNLAQTSPTSTMVAQTGYQQVSATTALTYNGTDSPSTSTVTACIATFFLAGTANKQPPSTPRRKPGRGSSHGQPGSATPGAAPTPGTANRQPPARARSRPPTRGRSSGQGGSATPFGTAGRQPAYMPPRRKPSRGSSHGQPGSPTPFGTANRQPPYMPPRRAPARASIQFTPVRTVIPRAVIADDGDAPWHIRSRRRRT